MLQKKNLDTNNQRFLKRLLLTILAVFLISTTVHADEVNQLNTVYHVYLDQDYIGKIDDQSVVQMIIDDKLANGKQEFEDLDIVIGESISYIEEKVFNPKYDNDKVKNELEEKLTIKAEAIALHIDGNIVGYFKDVEAAEGLIASYKEKFVSKDVLKALETETNEQEDKEESTQTLEIGDSLIQEVNLSKDLKYSKEKANPNDILDRKKGMNLLEKGTIEEKVHNVKEGDVLGAIASQYDLPVDKLLELNPSLEEDSLLQIDQEIHVTEAKPLVNVIVKEQKKVEEQVSHETEVIEEEEMYEGEEKVKQKGENGTKEVLYSLETVNGKVAQKEIVEEKVTKEPTKEIIIKGTKIIPSRGTGNLTWPAIGGYVSSYQGQRWGRAHKGIDIARPSNRAILAADHGVVTSASYNSGGYGNKIVINHNNGMKTIYAHLDSMSVKPGQKVEQGMEIGVMGSTGRSTGIHLHFEVYKNGKLQNPMSYLK